MNINPALNISAFSSIDTRSTQLNVSPVPSATQQSARPVTPLSEAEQTRTEQSSAENAAQNETEIESKVEELAQQRQELLERNQIRELASRDREVRAHEQAHAAVGGQYAGAPRYQFQRGPDGVNYAVGGEVSIDISPASTPEETIRKMQIVRAAALAPIDPSPQDRAVAAQASATLAQAQGELLASRTDESQEPAEPDQGDRSSRSEESDEAAKAVNSSSLVPSADGNAPVSLKPAPASLAGRLNDSISAAEGENVLGQLISQRA